MNHMAFYPPRALSPSNKNEKGDVVTYCYNFNMLWHYDICSKLL